MQVLQTTPAFWELLTSVFAALSSVKEEFCLLSVLFCSVVVSEMAFPVLPCTCTANRLFHVLRRNATF